MRCYLLRNNIIPGKQQQKKKQQLEVSLFLINKLYPCFLIKTTKNKTKRQDNNNNNKNKTNVSHLVKFYCLPPKILRNLCKEQKAAANFSSFFFSY